MGKYRKKPVVIEAVCSSAPFEKWPEWAQEAANLPPNTPRAIWVDQTDERAGFMIGTMEGNHHASPGDFIIQGVQGEIYPCKPDIFAATYEPAE